MHLTVLSPFVLCLISICFVLFQPKSRVIVCSVAHPWEAQRVGRELRTCKQSGGDAGGESRIWRASKALWIVLTEFVELCHWITEAKKILQHMSV